MGVEEAKSRKTKGSGPGELSGSCLGALSQILKLRSDIMLIYALIAQQ